MYVSPDTSRQTNTSISFAETPDKPKLFSDNQQHNQKWTVFKAEMGSCGVLKHFSFSRAEQSSQCSSIKTDDRGNEENEMPFTSAKHLKHVHASVLLDALRGEII